MTNLRMFISACVTAAAISTASGCELNNGGQSMSTDNDKDRINEKYIEITSSEPQQNNAFSYQKNLGSG
ncbi:MAG: hypothetical protein WKG03_07380 [Telluria sp.]